MMDAVSFLADLHRQIEEKLKELVSVSSSSPYHPLFDSAAYHPLFDSAAYSLLAKAKRLRPLLTLAILKSYHIPIEKGIVPACALEMVHTYSLIHDDLPSMDNDDLRRGLPSLHKKFPEWQALLTGDFLLTYAFEIISDAPYLTPEQKIALVRSLSHRAGIYGMIGGQMIDLLNVGKQMDGDLLEKMHLGKTAQLIAASLEFGGIIANAPKEDLQALQKAGLAIGIAFQLIDDILDCMGSEEELGKPLGSDAKKLKPTAVSLFGIEKTQTKALFFWKEADKHLSSLSLPVPLLRELFHQMVNRKK